VLFVGDDWAENHHDVEAPTGKKLPAARLPEGVAGITALHELIGRHLGEHADSAEADTRGADCNRSCRRDTPGRELGRTALTRASPLICKSVPAGRHDRYGVERPGDDRTAAIGLNNPSTSMRSPGRSGWTGRTVLVAPKVDLPVSRARRHFWRRGTN
jgi:hypothetical protein